MPRRDHNLRRCWSPASERTNERSARDGRRVSISPHLSEYAAQALRTHGARRGSWLTIKRLGRCRPNRPTADDPVPRPEFSV
ncbi:MAG: membrane protein insertion efficiency factor YidD [Candidatus Dormibacteria bacterium]